jgi:hypothetical protein
MITFVLTQGVIIGFEKQFLGFGANQEGHAFVEDLIVSSVNSVSKMNSERVSE